MHKTHWGQALVAAAAGIALSAIPSKSAAEIQQAVIEETTEIYAGGGELIHGLIVLVVVMAAVISSRLIKRKT